MQMRPQIVFAGGFGLVRAYVQCFMYQHACSSDEEDLSMTMNQFRRTYSQSNKAISTSIVMHTIASCFSSIIIVPCLRLFFDARSENLIYLTHSGMHGQVMFCICDI